MTLCGCGCGRETLIGKKTKFPNKFIKGHHRKNITASKETKEKMSLFQKGKKKSKETIEKIKFSKKGKSNGHEGLKHTIESKLKMSISHKNKYPSTETRLKLSISHLGKRAYQWKGGITPLYNQIRNCNKYKEWRFTIFNRDNFTCQECGKKGNGDLNVHHIKHFQDLIKDNNITTFELALCCLNMWNLNNGITLCEYCHSLKHNKD